MKILMVCLGNICRSPLAEGILAAKIKKMGLDWEVDSAGTSSWHIGELPDPRSIAIAKKYDIDITYQNARQLQAKDLEHFDLLFAMDASNYKNILNLAKNEAQRQKVKMILSDYNSNKAQSVPDPYWDDNGFEEVFQLLNNACDRIIEKYRDQ